MTRVKQNRIYRARFVFTAAGPPIADGEVAVEEGRIVGVGRDLGSGKCIDLGNVAILPGLVNAHAHLEFSLLKEPLGRPGIGFTDWIRSVIEYRRSGQLIPKEAVARGIAECARCGTTTLGEIATGNWPEAVWRQTAVDATIFFELIGLSPELAQERLADAAAHVNVGRDANWRAGLSPHAPYSVHPELLDGAIALACKHQVPLAMHVAESRDELQLLRDGTGPLAELLEDLGVWNRSAMAYGGRPRGILARLSQTPRSLVVHGNYLGDEDLAPLLAAGNRLAIVYCPRTHGYFKHEPYPLARYLKAGANVALGTDGCGSSPDLSLLAEMRYVATHHAGIPAATVLELGTRRGAEALGLGADRGTIEIGKRADLAIVGLPNADANEPHDLLFDSIQPVKATLRGGEVVYAGEPLSGMMETL